MDETATGSGPARPGTPATEETLEADLVASADTLAPAELPHAPSLLPMIETSVYERQDEVGRGGLGRIVRARDKRTGRIVAIKEKRIESTDAAARFVREALVTASLQHPAIVPV
jgi:serine/threonine protein kinase